MNIRQFFTCLNCIHQSNSILPLKNSLRHVLFPCKQPIFYHVFYRHCPTPTKQIHMELSDCEFFSQFSRILTFSTNKIRFWTKPNRVLIPSEQPAFYRVFQTHKEQTLDRQKPIKGPSLKYYPFLSFNVSSLTWDRNLSLVRVNWRYNSFSLLFVVKLRGLVFSFLEQRQWAKSLPQSLFGLVSQRALSPTRNRWRCVTRPNNGCD